MRLLMSKLADAQTGRQNYQLSVISECTTDITYIEGKSNLDANVNSHPPVEMPSEDFNDISTALSTSPLDLTPFAAAHHQWPITSAIFFTSPAINWSSFNQLVDASLDSSF